MVIALDQIHGNFELADQLYIELCTRPVMQSGKLFMPSTCQSLHEKCGRKQLMDFGANGTFQIV